MIKYVDFLNAWNARNRLLYPYRGVLGEQVREYFRNQPFILTSDTSKTIAPIWKSFSNKPEKDKLKTRERISRYGVATSRGVLNYRLSFRKARLRFPRLRSRRAHGTQRRRCYQQYNNSLHNSARRSSHRKVRVNLRGGVIR